MIGRRELLVGGLTASAGAVFGSPRPPRSRLSLGAYYYPWYSSDGRHWEQGWHGKGQGRIPELGKYSSRSPRVIRQHSEWAASLGLDHWIASWWGPDSWEDHTLRHHLLPFLESEQNQLGVCLLYETAGLLGLDPERGILFDEEARERLTEHFRFLSRHYFGKRNYHRVDQKPVVYFYLSRTFVGDWARALGKIRGVVEAHGFELFLVGDEVYWGAPDPQRIGAFDAITAYNMHGPERFSGIADRSLFLEECEEVYRRFRDIATDQGTAFIPGVIPGFDSRDAGGSYYVIPRNLKKTKSSLSFLSAYLDMAKRFVDPELSTLAITSFNEWHEGTQLEPARSADDELAELEQLIRGLRG